VASTVSKARSRSREVVTLDEEPRISLRVSTKLPSSSSSSMSKREIEKFIIRQPPKGEKMIMIVKTPGSQMGSPAAEGKYFFLASGVWD